MVSFLLHVSAVVAAVWISQLPAVPRARVREAVPLIFQVSSREVPVVLDKPVVRVTLPSRTVEVPKAVTEERPKAPVEVLPLPQTSRVEPQVPPREAIAAPPPIAPPAPPRQKALVAVPQEAFQQAAVPLQRAERGQVVQAAGFDVQQARATQPKLVEASLAGFDRTADIVHPRAASDRGMTSGTTPTGFSSAAPPMQPARPLAAAVRDAGFDAAPATQPAAAPRRPEAVAVPVEVTFKPTPSYTEEARALKLEGEVLLEVEFMASNQLRVLRVVRGLGHGLDEAAIQAAEQIRFKPGQSGGRPVDVRTIVHIVFKLA